MIRIPLMAAAACAALSAGFAGAAQAQTVEELTVMGRYGPDSEARSLSQAVSYADLNLTLPSDQAVFRHRVKLTARYLCDRLGETNSSDSVAPSCRAAAERDGLKQADALISAYRLRPQWAAGPVWVAPYPNTWVETYP